MLFALKIFSLPVPVPELFGKYPTRPVQKSKTPTRRTLLRRGRKNGREGEEGRIGAEEGNVRKRKRRWGAGREKGEKEKEGVGGGEKEEEEAACQYGRCVLSCVAAYLGTTTPNSAPLRLKMTRQLLAL